MAELELDTEGEDSHTMFLASISSWLLLVQAIFLIGCFNSIEFNSILVLEDSE